MHFNRIIKKTGVLTFLALTLALGLTACSRSQAGAADSSSQTYTQQSPASDTAGQQTAASDTTEPQTEAYRPRTPLPGPLSIPQLRLPARSTCSVRNMAWKKS